MSLKFLVLSYFARSSDTNTPKEPQFDPKTTKCTKFQIVEQKSYKIRKGEPLCLKSAQAMFLNSRDDITLQWKKPKTVEFGDPQKNIVTTTCGDISSPSENYCYYKIDSAIDNSIDIYPFDLYPKHVLITDFPEKQEGFDEETIFQFINPNGINITDDQLKNMDLYQKPKNEPPYINIRVSNLKTKGLLKNYGTKSFPRVTLKLREYSVFASPLNKELYDYCDELRELSGREYTITSSKNLCFKTKFSAYFNSNVSLDFFAIIDGVEYTKTNVKVATCGNYEKGTECFYKVSSSENGAFTVYPFDLRTKDMNHRLVVDSEFEGVLNENTAYQVINPNGMSIKINEIRGIVPFIDKENVKTKESINSYVETMPNKRLLNKECNFTFKSKSNKIAFEPIVVYMAEKSLYSEEFLYLPPVIDNIPFIVIYAVSGGISIVGLFLILNYIDWSMCKKNKMKYD